MPKDLQVFLDHHRFYKSLDKKQKRYFAHRVVRFLKHTRYIGREELVVDNAMRMQVAIMVTQLTFGMRHYLLEYLKTIILYPTSFYSVLNQTENIGEYNPRSKALVLSWEDFQKGEEDLHDGKSLGIHEITHAIHYNAIRNNNISCEIFYDTFLLLEKYIQDPEVREKIIEAQLLREYAYTDKFEFIAVLVEVFMESPKELKAKLPTIYDFVVQMLNFRYFDE